MCSQIEEGKQVVGLLKKQKCQAFADSASSSGTYAGHVPFCVGARSSLVFVHRRQFKASAWIM